MIYRYQVVTTNGHGIHGGEFESFKAAREWAAGMVDRRSTGVVLGPFEIERIGYLNYVGGTRRYWMRQRSRWVPWDHERDHTVRRPDHLWYEAFDPDDIEHSGLPSKTIEDGQTLDQQVASAHRRALASRETDQTNTEAPDVA